MTSMVQIISSSRWPIYCSFLIPLLLNVAASSGDSLVANVISNNFNNNTTTTTTTNQTQTQQSGANLPSDKTPVNLKSDSGSTSQLNVNNQQQQQQQHQNGSSYSHQQQQEQQNQNQLPPRRQQPASDEYLVGVGIADITGPAADINLVSLMRLLLGGGVTQLLDTSTASTAPGASLYSIPRQGTTSVIEDLIQISYPSVGDLTNVKMLLKINLKSLLSQTQMMNELIRWAMPNQIKMQVEYTYVNLVVQL